MVDNKLSEFRSIGKEEFGVESYDQYPGDFFRRIVTSECAAFAELADVAVCALPNRTVSGLFSLDYMLSTYVRSLPKDHDARECRMLDNQCH